MNCSDTKVYKKKRMAFYNKTIESIVAMYQ